MNTLRNLLRSLDDSLRPWLDDFLKFLQFLAEGFDRAGVMTIFDVGWFLLAAFLCRLGIKQRNETGDVPALGWILLIVGGVMIALLAWAVFLALNQRA